MSAAERLRNAEARVASEDETRRLPTWKRAEILESISNGIQDRHEEFSCTMALEAGKPIRTVRAEVDRAVFTFKIAAEESKRIYGEIVPLDCRLEYSREMPS